MTDPLGTATIISSLREGPACIGEQAVLICTINGSALSWLWNKEVIRVYNTNHDTCQIRQRSQYEVVGAVIYTILAVVVRDIHGNITGCTSMLEITPSIAIEGEILCLAKEGEDYANATYLYSVQGNFH